jgi:hypothetical protein
MEEWFNEWYRKIEEGDIGAILLLVIVGAVLTEIVRR